MAITFTLDLEDSRATTDAPIRFPAVTHRVLDALAARSVCGTFFVVAELARDHASVVRRIAEEGHEIALHGLRHVPLTRLDPPTLSRELIEGRTLLEECAGVRVEGFRAPIFSLVASTTWALDLLLEAGFAYSSSVLPASNPLHGWAAAPRRPFAWPQGLVELPCPVIGPGRLAVPYLGGFYVRALPGPLAIWLARKERETTAAWTYCHPYDFDVEEPFARLPEASWLTSRLLHLRRRDALERILAVIEAGGGPGPRLREVARAARDDARLPAFEPV